MPLYKQLPKGTDVGTFDVMPEIPAGPMAGAALVPYLISIYKTKAARQAGTKLFVDRALDSGSEALASAAQWFAERYPRVAAHMNLVPKPIPNYVSPLSGEPVAAHIRTPKGKVERPLDVEITQSGFDRMTPTSGNTYQRQKAEALNTLGHEGTHAAQALGNSDFNSLYNAMNMVTGYEHNPFEITARARGYSTQMGYSHGALPQTVLHPEVKKIMDQAAAASTAEQRMALHSIAEKMRFGGSGYIKGRDGFPQFVSHMAPTHPDVLYQPLTVPRLIEDESKIIKSRETSAYQWARETMKRRQGKK